MDIRGLSVPVRKAIPILDCSAEPSPIGVFWCMQKNPMASLYRAVPGTVYAVNRGVNIPMK